MSIYVCVCVLCLVPQSPWTVAHQALLPWVFSRQEYWSGLPCPPPEYTYTYIYIYIYAVLCLVTQSCPTLYNPMDSSPPGPSVHGDFSGKNTEMGCHALLQGIFPTRRSNPGLLHCRWIVYCLSHQGSPRILE